MALAIGYNVSKANELMQDINTAFKNLEGKIYSNWPTLRTKLQTEWVGEDEQDFETKFAETICNMYVNAGNVAQYAINIIENVTNEWYKFQQGNTLSGDASTGNSGGFLGIGGNKFNLDVPKINPNEKIIQAQLVQLTDSTDRGLTSESSATNIKSSVEEFVNQTKNDTKALFDTIDTGSAFFGSQTSAIKSLIEKAGESISTVTVAVKNLYDALDTLANTNYTTSNDNVSSSISSDAITNMETQVEGAVGTSRWS